MYVRLVDWNTPDGQLARQYVHIHRAQRRGAQVNSVYVASLGPIDLRELRQLRRSLDKLIRKVETDARCHPNGAR